MRRSDRRHKRVAPSLCISQQHLVCREVAPTYGGQRKERRYAQEFAIVADLPPGRTPLDLVQYISHEKEEFAL